MQGGRTVFLLYMISEKMGGFSKRGIVWEEGRKEQLENGRTVPLKIISYMISEKIGGFSKRGIVWEVWKGEKSRRRMAGEELAPLLPAEEEGKEAEHRGSYSRGKLDLGDVERWAKIYPGKKVCSNRW